MAEKLTPNGLVVGLILDEPPEKQETDKAPALSEEKQPVEASQPKRGPRKTRK